MNNTKCETREAHSQAILDLLDQCCEHLAALGCPPVHPKHEPDEHDCGHCDRCGGCVNCGNCAACNSCPDPESHKCCKNRKDAPENKNEDGEGSIDYIVMSVDDFGQLLDDMIALSDTIDGLAHFIHEKEHLAKTLMGIANRLVPSTQEQMLVQAANKTNATISERWDSIELAPIDED
ncbi:MAG: hypothetical protein LUD14_12145 [Clostridiales bacterium]|nr:hypothetical protein [Clostridiales bacterium]